MKLKTKLTLAFGFLFILILLLGGVGSYYLRWLAQDSRAIIRENYRTLQYMQNLENGLNTLQGQLPAAWQPEGLSPERLATTLAELDKNLALQQQNITEAGEQELTEQLAIEYNQLRANVRSLPQAADPREYYLNTLLPQLVRMGEQTDQIYLLNEETLLRKNEQANQTARTVTTYMNALGLITLGLALFFLVRIPELISRPIQQFSRGIQEIAAGHYGVSLAVESKDEFGELAGSFNRMAAKLQEYQHTNYDTLIREKRRLEAVINQMREPIIGLNDGKQIIFINQPALDILGLKPDQVLNRYAPDVAVSNPLLNKLIAGLMIGEDQDELARTEDRHVKAVVDDQERLFVKSVVDILDRPAGEQRRVHLGHVIMLNDITEFSERDQAKTHFMATLSHELKTPMAAIQMSSKLLQNPKIGELNPEQSGLIMTIQENNQRVQRMITELLDISKIESGSVEVSKVASSPQVIVEKAVEGVRLFLQDKQIRLATDLADNLPQISADPHKLVWVLNNFLTNAIRYTPVGELITVLAVRQNGGVVLSVLDKGPGISTENQKRIFKRFFRVADDISEGTGLGLAISQEFIYAMGGDIGVDSEPGHGSRFWVKLPAVC
jgi:signal transduction histidine kinase/HAMP domain-containing protein